MRYGQRLAKRRGHCAPTGGSYAVAVEVDAVYPVDDPSEACYTPETMRYLEPLEQLADKGDVEGLRRAGKVYVRLPESA